jgi:lipase chaperone LimK
VTQRAAADREVSGLMERLTAFENHLFGPEADLVNEAAARIAELEWENAYLRGKLEGYAIARAALGATDEN